MNTNIKMISTKEILANAVSYKGCHFTKSTESIRCSKPRTAGSVLWCWKIHLSQYSNEKLGQGICRGNQRTITKGTAWTQRFFCSQPKEYAHLLRRMANP